MFLDGSKFREHFFEKGHQRIISVKLFQNLTSNFREDGLIELVKETPEENRYGNCRCDITEIMFETVNQSISQSINAGRTR